MTGRDLGFPLLGRALRATGLPDALERWIRHHWHFPEQALAPHPFRITVQALDAAPAKLGGATREVKLHGGITLAWRGRAGVWETGDRAAGVRLTPATTESRIELWGAERWAAQPDLYAALCLALCESLRLSGLVPLHASAAGRDGEVTLFTGHSGVGKTTTLLRALRAGWTALAEDLSWLEPTSRTLHGWDRGLRLWDDGLARIAPELPAGAGEWERDVDGKRILPYARLGAPLERTGRWARLAVLVRDPSRPSAWEDLASRDAVRALWEATGVPLTPEAQAAVARVLPALLADVELRRLRLGNTPLPL